MAAVAALRPCEVEEALENVGAYLNAYRPWMSLLGVRLRPAGASKERQVRACSAG